MYIWVSNETPGRDVFFDNLSVKQYRGPITEETHYYPFGLTMAGISDQAASGLENKIKFQGQEFQYKQFSDGSGLEMYEFKYRMDDPQLGRFCQVDPLASDYPYNSTYAFSEDKVTSGRELEGLEYEALAEEAEGIYEDAEPYIEKASEGVKHFVGSAMVYVASVSKKIS